MIDTKNDRLMISHNIPYGATLLMKDGQKISKGDIICTWDPFNNVIIAEQNGTLKFENVIEGVTFREESDEQTGHREKVVIETRDKTKIPSILVEGKEIKSYNLPTGSHIVVEESDEVKAGQVIVKIPRVLGKLRDITGGLPRVTELFEARNPSNPAIVSEIDGVVTMGAVKRGNREIIIEAKDGVTRKYLVPLTRQILAQDGDFVKAGNALSDGQIAPQDILSVQGTFAVQQYVVNENQEVYRLQGVKINDKHIEVIVRQMMQKVEITNGGDTTLLAGEQVDREEMDEINARLEKKQKKAEGKPVLLGITKASLQTRSFISAASFQETTRVLTEAAVQGKVDTLEGLKENVIVGRLIPAGTGAGMNRLRVAASSRDTALRAAQRRMQEALIAPDSAEELRAAELARSPREDSGTGDDPLGEVVPSGHGLDADAGDYLQD